MLNQYYVYRILHMIGRCCSLAQESGDQLIAFADGVKRELFQVN